LNIHFLRYFLQSLICHSKAPDLPNLPLLRLTLLDRACLSKHRQRPLFRRCVPEAHSPRALPPELLLCSHAGVLLALPLCCPLEHLGLGMGPLDLFADHQSLHLGHQGLDLGHGMDRLDLDSARLDLGSARLDLDSASLDLDSARLDLGMGQLGHWANHLGLGWDH